MLQRDRLGRPVVTVEDPAKCWAYHRERLAEGVRGQDARGIVLLLRQLKEAVEGLLPPAKSAELAGLRPWIQNQEVT